MRLGVFGDPRETLALLGKRLLDVLGVLGVKAAQGGGWIVLVGVDEARVGGNGLMGLRLHI